MPSLIGLDAGNPPPSPAQWVTDLDAADAAVGQVYVGPGGEGAGKYSAAHVAKALAAGKKVTAICYPGKATPTFASVAAVCAALGIPIGVLWWDVADGDQFSGDWPWLQGVIGEAQQAGWRGGPYCQTSVRPSCPWGDWWVAAGPVVIPAGAMASQYAADVTINGTEYDLSALDLSLWEDHGAMKYIRYTSPPGTAASNAVDRLAWVDSGGVLHMDSMISSSGQWVSNVIGSGHMPCTDVEAAIDSAGNLNLWALGANGQRFHWVYNPTANGGQGTWNGLPD